MQSFGPLCRTEYSGQVKVTCVNRDLAAYLDMLSQFVCPFAVFVSTLGELMGRLWIVKPSGSVRPTCEDAAVKVTVRDGMHPIRAQFVLKVGHTFVSSLPTKS